MVKLLWKMIWQFLKKLKIKVPYDPVVTLLGLHPKPPPEISISKTSYTISRAVFFRL